MSNNLTHPDNGVADGPWELLTVIFTGLGFLGAVVGSAAMLWNKLIGWLLAEELLVAAGSDPLWVLPAADGAGLDLMRVAIVAGAFLILVVAAFSSAVRVVTRRRRVGDLA